MASVKQTSKQAHGSGIGQARAAGNKAFSVGDYASAVAAYTRCLAADSNQAAVLSNRAMAHLKREAFAEVSRRLCVDVFLGGDCAWLGVALRDGGGLGVAVSIRKCIRFAEGLIPYFSLHYFFVCW